MGRRDCLSVREGTKLDQNAHCLTQTHHSDDSIVLGMPSILQPINSPSTPIPWIHGQEDFSCGDEAISISKRGILRLNRPIEDGIINSRDDMERLIFIFF